MTSLQEILQEKNKFDVHELIKKQKADLQFMSLTNAQKKNLMEQ